MSSCPALWLKPTSLQDAILCLDPLPQLPPQDLLRSCFLRLKTKMQGLSSHTEPCIIAATSVLAARRSSSSHQAIDLSVRARLSPGLRTLLISLYHCLLEASGVHTTLKDFFADCSVSPSATQHSAVKIKMCGVDRIMGC